MQQIGWSKFKVMVGAYDIFHDDNGDSFQFKFKAKAPYNWCKIRYVRASDTYKVELKKIGRKLDKELSKLWGKRKYSLGITKEIIFEDVYFDSLSTLFEDVTGLATAL